MSKLLREFAATLSAAHYEAQLKAAKKVQAYNAAHMMASCALLPSETELLHRALNF